MIPSNPKLNFMHLYPSPEDLDLSAKICSDEKTFSDSSGISNKDKWLFAMDVMECDDCSLFSEVSFEQIYMEDDPLFCEAAAYIADLRSQFLLKELEKFPRSLESHQLYIRNRQWYARLREHQSLQALGALTKNIVLT